MACAERALLRPCMADALIGMAIMPSLHWEIVHAPTVAA